MEIAQLKLMTKEEVLNFIRQRLSFSSDIKRQLKHVNEDAFNKEHRRFEKQQGGVRFSTLPY